MFQSEACGIWNKQREEMGGGGRRRRREGGRFSWNPMDSLKKNGQIDRGVAALLPTRLGY